jgi:hypothetical protein
MKKTITMEYKRQYRDLPDEVKQKISASTKGRAKSYDHKQHISQGMKRYWDTVPSRTSSSDTNNTDYQGEDVIKNNERKDGIQ